jgi:hypothetical protein
MWLGAVSCLPRDRDVQREPVGTRSEGSAKSKTEDAARRANPNASGTAQRGLPPPSRAERAKLDPLLSEPFSDNFERTAAGAEWRLTGSGWKIEDGRFCGQKARNHPAWLARRLPENASIEFDATSFSPDGDIKVEVWGDGASAATSASYTNASSYIVIFGGWKNRFHVLARLDEHGKDRREIDVESDSDNPLHKPVEPERSYHFKVERRDGKTLTWHIDNQELHRFEDAEPLSGEGHDHIAFNNWDVRVCFDNLTITPL